MQIDFEPLFDVAITLVLKQKESRAMTSYAHFE
jgi:hypothetical protein